MARLLRAAGPALIIGIGGLVLWEVSFAILQPEGFVLPAPSEIMAAFIENSDEIWAATKNTGYPAHVEESYQF